MICVITDPIDLANYIDVFNLRKRRPAERVCHIKWGDLSTIAPAETLYLLAHGSPAQVEGYVPKDLAELLVKRGLKKPLKKIKLLVCASGVYQSESGGKIIPYCQKLADALVTAGGPATVVVGFDGDTAVTDGGGKTFAKDKRQKNYPNWSDFDKTYGKAFAKLDAEAERLPFGDEKTIIRNAGVLQAKSVDCFEWLYTNNKLYTLPSPKGKTYGIPGQKIAGRPYPK